MPARYRGSYRGIGEMLCAPWMEADMRVRAERVAAWARVRAPIDTPGPHPGLYKSSFKVTSGIRVGRTRRSYARVTNDAPYARWVEYGNAKHGKNNAPAQYVLTGALVAARS